MLSARSFDLVQELVSCHGSEWFELGNVQALAGSKMPLVQTTFIPYA